MFSVQKILNINMLHSLHKTNLHQMSSRLIFVKSFHSSRFFCNKIYMDHENINAHRILQANNIYHVCRPQSLQLSIPSIEQYQFEDSVDWKNLSCDKMLEYLRIAAQFCKHNSYCISDAIFDSFVDQLTEKVFEFSDDQLITALQILTYLPETESVNTRNFSELWNSLDDACLERLKDWNFDKILYVCDHWYVLKLGKLCKFNWSASTKIGRKITKLPPHQLVQTMFYCNILRQPMITMFDFEVSLAKSIDQLSINEIAVMSMGFFKTQTSIKNPDLIEIIYNRLIKEVTKVQDISLVNIIKNLRYSSKPQHADVMYKLLDKLVHEIPRLSLLSCLHVALIGTDILLLHEECLELIVERFVKDIKQSRLKDMERLCFILSLFAAETKTLKEKELGELIIEEIKNRVPENTKHPRCFSCCVHYLSLMGIHDEELISTVLDSKFLTMAYGNALLGREIFNLDSFTRINLKETYTGNQLSQKHRQKMGKMYSQYIPIKNGKFKLTATDKQLLQIKDAADELYKYSEIRHVLPHFERPDILMAYDKAAGVAVDISDSYPQHYSGNIITKNILLNDREYNAEIEIIQLILGGWNNFVKNKETPTGILKLKIRQAKLIGNIPVMIPWYEWIKLTEQERTIYLKHKISMEL